MDPIHNERTKLTATWINGLSLAFFGVGTLGPWIAYLNAPSNFSVWLPTIVSTLCVLLAGSLHLLGRSFLGRMKA